MKNHHIVRFIAIGCLLAGSSHAQTSFFDRFDTEPVGSFPSTWNNVSHFEPGFIVTNYATAPSAPNVFQLAHRANDDFHVTRPFPQVSLNVSSQLVYNFKLNVEQIPGFFSPGAWIGLGNLSQGEETFATMRILSDPGSSNTWSIFNQYYGGNGGSPVPASGLLRNTWYDFRFEIKPTTANAQSGIVTWYLNDALINVETYTVPSVLRTNINYLWVRHQGNPYMIFDLDNVRVFNEIPEPSSLVFATAAAVGLGLVTRRRQRQFRKENCKNQRNTHMKNRFTLNAIAILVGLASCYTTSAQLYTNTIFEDNFDNDTVGQLPSGWSGLPAVNPYAFVSNDRSVSSPNSFQINIIDNTDFTVMTPFPAHNLANGDPDNRLSYSIDINVDFIDQNNGEGIRLRIWNGTSQIDVGTPRILKLGTTWNFYNAQAGGNGGGFYNGAFNFDQWYNFRVVITPLTPTSGTAQWYIKDLLLNTPQVLFNSEIYTLRSPVTQTSNLDVFDIFTVLDGVATTDATIYFDNLLIQSIVPEPSSLALLAVGGLILLRRRSR